jgi:hypothetical protein
VKGFLIRFFTFLGGIYFFVDFVMPKHVFVLGTTIEIGAIKPEMLRATQVVTAMALGLGILNLVRIHGYALVRLRSGWINSLGLLVAMFATLVIGFWNVHFPLNATVSGMYYDLIEKGLFQNLGAAMFSLLAFYIAYAAYRSFRIQSLESAVMMASAVLVMIGQIPLGLWIWDGIPIARAWILTKVNVPVVRAIVFGSLIATLSMAVRMWLSLERTGRV